MDLLHHPVVDLEKTIVIGFFRYLFQIQWLQILGGALYASSMGRMDLRPICPGARCLDLHPASIIFASTSPMVELLQ